MRIAAAAASAPSHGASTADRCTSAGGHERGGSRAPDCKDHRRGGGGAANGPDEERDGALLLLGAGRLRLAADHLWVAHRCSVRPLGKAGVAVLIGGLEHGWRDVQSMWGG